MLYCLDFLSAITSLSLWLGISIAVFVIVLIIYVVATVTQGKAVITSVALPKDAAVTAADHLYYLPTASVTVTATATVLIFIDAAGEIADAALHSLQLVQQVKYEADTTQLYTLNYRSSSFANDDIKINTSADGLLETVFASTEDRVGNIIATLSEAPANILTDGIVPKGIRGAAPIHVTVQTREFTNTFTIFSSQWVTGQVIFPWIIPIEGQQQTPFTVDATITLNFPPQPIRHAPATPVAGLFTRPLKKLAVTAIADIGRQGAASAGTFEISIPDTGVMIFVPVTRAAFVKKIHTPKFQQGMLTENFINKPSEAEGFVSIPINILKAIFSIPAQLLSFRIFHLGKEEALVKAMKKLEDARQEAAEQEAKRKAGTASGQLPPKPKPPGKTSDEGADTAAPEPPEPPEPPAPPSPGFDILVEAIKAHQQEWKAKFNVIEIGIGKKKVNGLETEEDVLVFKPEEKLEHGRNVFVPIPPFLPFRSNGVDYNIPTDVQQTGGPVLPAFIPDEEEACDLNTPKFPGCSVSRLNNDDTGTIGLKVFKDNKSYILSCYHVICSTELSENVFTVTPTSASGDRTVISPGIRDQGTEANVIGKVTEGKFNEFMDCAIAELNDDLDVKRRICRIDQEPSGTIIIRSEHTKPRLTVFMSGRTSQFRSAKIKSAYTSTDVTYSFGKFTLNGLISTTPLAKEGDSGAVVFDEDCKVVGIVVARSSSDTYIIPIGAILTAFKVKLKP